MIWGDALARMLFSIGWTMPKIRLIHPTPRAMTDNFGYPDGACKYTERYLWTSPGGGGVDRATVYADTTKIELNEGALPALEPGIAGISNSLFEV